MLRLTNRIIDEYNMLANCLTVIAAVSGGADSVCMLHLLKTVCKSRNIQLVCAHYNHSLRGDESDADEAYVKTLCERQNIRLFCESGNVASYADEHNISIESAAREKRYEFLNRIAAEFKNARIATAHTANDNAETVLLNLTRGSGLKGLCGIPAVRDNIIRPILLLSRLDTERYCKDNCLGYVTDKTNFDTKYSRNKIRLEVLPLLSQVNSEAVSNICKAAHILETDNRCLENLADKAYNNSITSKGLELELLRDLDEALLARVALRFVKENTTADYDNLHILEVVKLIRFGVTGSRLQLNGKTFLEMSYNRLIATDNIENKYLYNEITVNKPGVYSLNGIAVTLELTDSGKDKKALLDYDKISFPLTLRTPLKGDSFKIPKVGTKPLNRLLTDRKIPRGERFNLPLLACGSEVVWVSGVGASEKYKTDNNTEKYIIINIKENTL